MHTRYFAIKHLVLICLLGLGGFSRAEVFHPSSLNSLPALEALIQKHRMGRVNHFVQDQMGFIWLAGANGLARYNGHELSVYRHQEGDPSSLPGNQVNALLVDKNGRLWVATLGGLATFNMSSDKFEVQEFPGKTNNVTCLAEDRLNYVIACINDHIVFIDKNNFETTRYALPQSGAGATEAVLIDHFNRLWLAGANHSLALFDIDARQFIRLPEPLRNQTFFKTMNITALFEDQSSRIWLGTHNGVKIFDENSGTIHNLPFVTDSGSLAVSVQKISVGLYGEVLVGTRNNGLWYYNAEADQLEPVDHGLPSINKIKTLYHDKSGNLWLSEFSGRLFYRDVNATRYTSIKVPAVGMSSSHAEVFKLFHSKETGYWLASSAGLFSWMPETETLEPFLLGESLSARPAVLDIAQMKAGSLWLLLNGEKIVEVDVATGKTLFEPDVRTIDNVSIQQIAFDKQGKLWIVVGTAGVYQLIPSSGEITRYSKSNPVEHLYVDSKGFIWAISASGLLRFDEQQKDFVAPHWAGDEVVSSAKIRSLYEADGQLWMGTKQKGLIVYDSIKDELKFLDMSNGLVSNNVASIQADAQGYIWVTTDLGLAKVNPQTLVVDSRVNERSLGSNYFDRNVSLRDDRGRVYFAGTEGVSMFHPSDFISRMDRSPLVISRVYIERQEGAHSLSYSSMSLSTIGREAIILDHKDRAFTFEFALLDFHSPQKNRYVYQLEGFEEKWHFVGNRNYATYTNLPPGEYRFKVKAANTDGLWSAQASEILVQIKPQIWLSFWAYLVYACFALAALVLLWKSQVKRVDLIKERKLNDRLRRVERIKDAILANTSLEIRTPLNNIVGLSESLADGVAGEVSIAAKDYLKRIVESSRYLTNLVDNILEYSSLVGSEAVIIKKPMDLKTLVQSVLTSFQKKAKEKDIVLQNLISEALPLIYADEARMQQILMNLVENAIAHSHSGTVSVGCRELHETLEFFVEDCGVGIAKEQQAFLFDPFYVGERENNRPVSGIGLGLAVTKHLVEMHGGSISVESTPGEGSTFTVHLPLTEGVKLASREVAQTRLWNANLISGPKPENLVMGDYVCGLENTEAYTILVVDDDAINRMVITGMLSQCRYNTIEAASGEDAMKILENKDKSIDLVIMDVVLPRMSGFETCQKIRESFGFYELPVIFLTAKKVTKSAMEGFCVGGNEFLFKPITKYELLPRLANLLKLSENSRQHKIKKLKDC